MKFKVGDKVKILPSAVDGGVSEKAVGKIGKITMYRRSGNYFLVIMDGGQDTGVIPSSPWAVHSDQMEHVVVIGQQLLFDFMQQS